MKRDVIEKIELLRIKRVDKTTNEEVLEKRQEM